MLKEMVIEIYEIKRLNNSIYGNPRYEIKGINNQNKYVYAKTKSDALCNYILDWTSTNKKYKITYHFTKNGNMIINTMKEIY